MSLHAQFHVHSAAQTLAHNFSPVYQSNKTTKQNTTTMQLAGRERPNFNNKNSAGRSWFILHQQQHSEQAYKRKQRSQPSIICTTPKFDNNQHQQIIACIRMLILSKAQPKRLLLSRKLAKSESRHCLSSL